MKIIGHRGAKGLAPENTAAGIACALQYKVDEIEIDVRLTSDNVPVLMHDKDLRRIAGSHLRVQANTFKTVAAAYPDILSLTAALELIGDTPVRIEIKPGISIQPILTVITQRPPTQHITVASFDWRIVAAVHEAMPDIPVIVNERWSGVRAQYKARRAGTTHIAMNHRWLWRGYIQAMKRSGYTLDAYPLNSPSKATRFVRAGLDGVITDYPDRITATQETT